MMLKTVSDYQKEIARAQAAIDSTNSEYLRRDYGKYIKRLKREAKALERGKLRKNCGRKTEKTGV